MSITVPPSSVLRDGTTVDVRPVRPDDEPALAALLRGLSVRSRRLRFCGAVGDAGLAEEARREAHVGDARGFGVVATAGPERRVVGHAEYAGVHDGRAEVSFAVADEFQGRGLGPLLLERLAEAARARGVDAFEAFVLPENHRMLAVFRRCGHPLRTRAARGEIRVELATAAGAAPRSSGHELPNQEGPMKRHPSSIGSAAAVAAVALLLGAASAATAGAQADTTRPAAQPLPTPSPPIREPRYPFGNRGFTMGLGLGAAMPTGTFRELGYDPGIHATVPIGWRRPGSPLGVRATLTFDRPTTGSSEMLRAAPGVPRPVGNPRIYTATLDAVLTLPIIGMGSDGYGIAAYAVAGGGGYRFAHYGAATPLADALGSDVGKSRVTRWGVDAGGGLEWGRGPTSVFVEARWVNVFADGSRAGNDYLRWVPVVVGITIH